MTEVEQDERPPTIGDPSTMVKLADGVWVIPDAHRTPHVPNVGIVVGERAALIVDSGLGAANADRVFAALRTVSQPDRVYLTQTHFHPEHGFGAQRLRDRVLIVYNAAQFEELQDKGQMFLEMFRGFSASIAEALEDVTFVTPDLMYAERAQLDLGGITVELCQQGPAHTRGDQSVFLSRESILFTGDLVEERFFPILPDGDSSVGPWIAALERLEALEPQQVVPGHGSPGGLDLLRDYRLALVEWRALALAFADARATREEITDTLSRRILNSRPDWENQEWVVPMIQKCLDESPRRDASQ
jgi:glyoxylase-like metal-dependent hydrolase (beta-lactamase superfamily II)